MAEFEVTKDGQTFVVTAPDMAAAADGVRRYFGPFDPSTGPTEPPSQFPVLSWLAGGRTTPRQTGEPAPFGSETVHWAVDNPAEAAVGAGRFGAQTAGTLAGIAGGGAVAGPAGAVGGGAAMSVLARQVYDAVLDTLLGTSERPDVLSLETGVDAIAGGVGPAAGSLLRGSARALTGLRQSDFNRLRNLIETTLPTGVRELGVYLAHNADDIARLRTLAAREGLSSAEHLATLTDEQVVRSVQAILGMHGRTGVEVGRTGAVRDALAGVRDPMAMARRGLLGGGAGAMLSGEPIIGGLIGAGLTEAVASRAVPALLRGRLAEPFAQWALNYANGTMGPAQAIRALTALAAEHQLTRTERAAIAELEGAIGNVPSLRTGAARPERRTERRNPFEIVMTPRGERARDPITGQWTSLE